MWGLASRSALNDRPVSVAPPLHWSVMESSDLEGPALILIVLGCCAAVGVLYAIISELWRNRK